MPKVRKSGSRGDDEIEEIISLAESHLDFILLRTFQECPHVTAPQETASIQTTRYPQLACVSAPGFKLHR
jgi:hypothetical protein